MISRGTDLCRLTHPGIEIITPMRFRIVTSKTNNSDLITFKPGADMYPGPAKTATWYKMSGASSEYLRVSIGQTRDDVGIWTTFLTSVN